MRKNLHLIILSIFILLIAVTIGISLVLYPDWMRDPLGTGLYQMVAMVVINVLGVIVSFYQLLKDKKIKKVERMTPEQRHNTRVHLKTGLLFTQKNLLDGFLNEYLGDVEPVPFGGRDAQLAVMDHWLNDPNGSPYFMMTAPAGRGKTHLLVQWVARLITQPKTPVRVILVPISIRFGTAQPEIHLQMLARALSQFYNDPIQDTASDTRITWRNICAEYLSKKEKTSKEPLLVILDGLDESTDPDLDQWRSLIGSLSTSTRVLLSARWLGEEVNEIGWRNRLGLSPTQADHLLLPPLDVTGLRQVLESMGNPLKGYAHGNDILRELVRLTSGDPLLVRRYIQDLHDHLKPDQRYGKEIDASEVLARLKASEPDLKGYFKGWWQDQRKQWLAQGENISKIEDDLREFLRLLATSVAPLRGDEIQMLIETLEFSYQQERLAERAPRIIIGSSKDGYSLSHPRFGIFFYEEMEAKERAAIETRFLTAIQLTLEGVQNGSIPPERTMPYFIFHARDHLLRALKDGRAAPDNLYALVCEPWLRAHEHLSGTPASFLEDVEAAWIIACQQPCGDPGQQVLALLCFTSVATLSSNIPIELIVKAYLAGVVNRAQALAFIRQNYDLARMCAGIVQISEIETDPDSRKALQLEALEIADQIEDPVLRIQALSEIANYLPPEQARAVVQQFRDAQWRARALAAIASHFPAEQQTNLLNEALGIARQIENPDLRARTLAEISRHLLEEQQRIILNECLETALEIENPDIRMITLGAIAPFLPADQALSVIQQIDDPFTFNNALAEIAPHLPTEQALPIARKIQNRDLRTRTLAKIVPHLPADQALEITRQMRRVDLRAQALADIIPNLPIGQGLEVAREIEIPYLRAKALSEIASNLPDEKRKAILSEALKVARLIGDTDSGVRSLAAIAPHLPTEQGLEILCKIEKASERAHAFQKIAHNFPADQVIEFAHQFKNSDLRDHLLAKTVSRLPVAQACDIAQKIENPRIFAEAIAEIAPLLPTCQSLAVARQIEDPFLQANTLAGIALQFKGDRDKGLEIGRQIEDPCVRAQVILEIGQQLPHEKQSPVYQEAITASRQIKDPSRRAVQLARISRSLPVDQQPAIRHEAIESARAVVTSISRAITLVETASQFPTDQQMDILLEALKITRLIRSSDARAITLAEIAIKFPPEQQIDLFNEALAAVRLIRNADTRSYALTRLVPLLLSEHLPDLWSDAIASHSTHLIGAIIKRWPDFCSASGISLQTAFSGVVRTYQHANRESALQLVLELSPAINHLGDQKTWVQIESAIQRVRIWWP